MPIRDILLAILLVFNVYFAYVIYDLNTENKEILIIEKKPSQVEAFSEIGYEEYAALYMFKEILPADIFEETLLPEIELAFKDGTINKDEWVAIQLQIKNLENNKAFDFKKSYQEKIKEKSLSGTLEEMLDTIGGEAKNLSDSLKEDFKDLVDKHKDSFQNKKESDLGKNTEPNPQDQNTESKNATAL